jgi:hypothetical protein
MRAKTAFYVAMASLFLTPGSTGNCFAASGAPGEPKEEKVDVAGTTRSEWQRSNIALESVDGAATTERGEGANVSVEEAAPTNERPGRRSFPELGIGLKV